MSNPMKEHIKDYPENNGDGARKIIQEPSEENPAWDDPITPNQMSKPDIPATLLPGWLCDYVDALSKTTQTPPGMAVMMALAVVATCIQKRFEVCPYGDDYREPLSLWTAVAMPPASRKTAIVTAITQPLVDWEVEQLESLKDEIADTDTKIAVNQKAIDRLQNEAAYSPLP